MDKSKRLHSVATLFSLLSFFWTLAGRFSRRVRPQSNKLFVQSILFQPYPYLSIHIFFIFSFFFSFFLLDSLFLCNPRIIQRSVTPSLLFFFFFFMSLLLFLSFPTNLSIFCILFFCIDLIIFPCCCCCLSSPFLFYVLMHLLGQNQTKQLP